MWLLSALYNRPIFKRETPVGDDRDVIRWWESRRLFFNFVVGCAGILTCILVIVCAFVSEPIVGEAIGLPDGPLLGVFGIFFYAILANVFYTFGWICELLARTMTATENSAVLGVRSFRAGVTFSILLTLSPIVVCWLAFALAVLHGQTHGPAPE
jgi:hypothetical protein